MLLFLPVTELYFPHAMPPHQATLVDVSADTTDVSLAGVLPGEYVTVVDQFRLSVTVFGNEKFVSVKFAGKVSVVEVLVSVYERLLTVFAFDERKKSVKRVAQFFTTKTARSFDVNHGNEVLVLRTTLITEIAQLFLLRLAWTVEMVRPDLESITACQLDIMQVSFVNARTSFAGFQVYVIHLTVCAYRFPPNVTLVVAHVETVDVVTCVFTLNVILCM